MSDSRIIVAVDPSNIVIAIGTISLAIATLVLALVNRGQLQILKSQNIREKYSSKPHLIIKEFSVNKNTITITLKNIGNGLAKEIGLSTTFNPMFKQNNDFHLIPSDKFEYDGKLMQTTESGTFLKPKNNFSTILEKDEEQTFTANNLYFEMKEGVGFMGGDRQFFPIEKLIEFLKTKQIHAFAITIGLLYKDLSEEIISQQHHRDLIFDLDKHKFLEDCITDNLRPYGLPITLEQTQDVVGFFDVEMYRKLKLEKK
jgi:hypothetical protein